MLLMDHESSLLCSQEPATCPCSDADQYGQHPSTLFS
jgi:hypothetical protein